MKVVVTGDFLAEGGFDEILVELENRNYREFFGAREYGEEVFLGIVFRLLQPGLRMSSQAEWNPATRFLGVDIVLPTEDFLGLDQSRRRAMVLGRLCTDAEKAVVTRAPKGFEAQNFVADLKSWVTQIS